MQIKTRMKKVAVGLSFAQVAAALGEGMHNICSYELESGCVDEFLRKHDLFNVPHVFMATHSRGGREWKFEEGREPAFYEDETFDAGWHVCGEEDVRYLFLESATSSSTLAAEKQRNGSWTVTLEVPYTHPRRARHNLTVAQAEELAKQDLPDEPYKGAYWKSFHEGLGLEQPSEEEINA